MPTKTTRINFSHHELYLGCRDGQSVVDCEPIKSSKDEDYLFLMDSSLDATAAHVDAASVRCVDVRFFRAWKNIMPALGIRKYDPLVPPGGVKVFSSPECQEHRDYFLYNLDIAVNHHGARRVILTSHHDCLAYGGFGPGKRFRDVEEEFKFHVAEHITAREVILKSFPQVEIRSFFIDNRGPRNIRL